MLQALHHSVTSVTQTTRYRVQTLSAAELRDRLLAVAPRPAYAVSIALAGVVARSFSERGPELLPLYGLDARRTQRILNAHFPGSPELAGLPWDIMRTPESFSEAIELDDLLQLLVEHRSVADEDSIWLAHAVVTACVCSDHLWQDMNLPSRKVLSDLLHGFFTMIAVRNRQDMKWKKFLYLQLCERAEIRVCKAPSCGVCVDYAVCYGPEV